MFRFLVRFALLFVGIGLIHSVALSQAAPSQNTDSPNTDSPNIDSPNINRQVLENPAPGNSSVEREHLDRSQLSYYLIQAFQAKSASSRLPLNHIGIQVQQREQGYLVTAVLEDYPAHRAGISRGDWIRSVDGNAYHPVYSFNEINAEATEFSSAEVSVELVFERNASTTTVQITPRFENLYDSYRTATVNSTLQFSSGNKVIAYVRLWGLSRNGNDLSSFAKLIREHRNSDGLILDLRNSFGYLGTELLDLLLANRRSFFSTAQAINDDNSLTLNHPRARNDHYSRPIAILVNAQTQSGAELFAYQLAKQERVITVGDSTAGKIGHYLPVDEARSPTLLYVPALETLIDGTVFEARGVTPEQAVDYPFTQSSRSDPQFETAVSLLLGII